MSLHVSGHYSRPLSEPSFTGLHNDHPRPQSPVSSLQSEHPSLQSDHPSLQPTEHSSNGYTTVFQVSSLQPNLAIAKIQVFSLRRILSPNSDALQQSSQSSVSRTFLRQDPYNRLLFGLQSVDSKLQSNLPSLQSPAYSSTKLQYSSAIIETFSLQRIHRPRSSILQRSSIRLRSGHLSLQSIRNANETHRYRHTST